jgi:uncharacterized protein (DUF885 family)
MTMDEQFERINWEMLQKFLKKNPGTATFLGFHDPYDKLLGDATLKAVYENLELIEEWHSQVEQNIDFEALSDSNKIDWQVLDRAYNLWRFSFYERRTHEKDPEGLDGIGTLIFIMLVRNYAPFDERVDSIVARLEKLPLYLKQFRTRFEKSLQVKLWTEIALEKGQRVPAFFQFLVGAAKRRVPEALHHRLQKAVAALDQPLKDHLEWLKSLLPTAKEEWALGKAKFDRLLELRQLGMTSDAIYQLGVKYLKELKAERASLAGQIAPGKSVTEVLKQIQGDAPTTFEEVLKLTRQEVARAKQFLIANDIATVDERDVLHVEETPAFIAPLIPFAALWIPGHFEKVQEGIYTVTRPNDIKDLGKDANYASIPNTAVHEAYPGHFLQTARSNRSGSFVRHMGAGTETVEGWAHYCEEMMREHGFQKSLESRLMQVNEMIWRAARVIIDVNLSRGEMSFDDAVDMLITETGMSKNGAIAEVRRYTQSPGQPLSYLVGKHLILKLRDEIKERMGDAYDEKFFHDTMTENGYLPIALLRNVFELKLAQT